MRLFIGLVAALLCAPFGQAALVTFTANLDGAQQVQNPSVTTNAFGSALLTLDTVAKTYDVNLSVFNLDPATLSPVGSMSAVHIHLGAIGVNGTVLSDLGAPANTTQINFGNFGFSLSGQGIAVDDATIDAMLANETYINVHTTAFPAGEIRGQLLAATAIPEPGSIIALTALACGLMVYGRRRRLARLA